MQLVQLASPVTSACMPATQSAHAEAPAAAYVLVAHGAQLLDATKLEYLPPAQLTQTMEPGRSW